MIGPSIPPLAERLLRPRAIALCGLPGPTRQIVLANLEAGGFPGTVQSIDTADGIATVPDRPDLGVVTDEDAEPAIAAFAASGVPLVIAIGQGARRPDTLGGAVAPKPDGRPHMLGTRVLGPGAFGVIAPAAKLNLSLGHVPARPGKLALISPSQALCRAVLDWAEPYGVGFSAVIGAGWETDVDAAAILDVLAREPGVGAILLDVRGIRDRRAFMSAARAAARLRPVIALHAGAHGRDPTGRSDRVFDAALRRAGVLRVGTMAELLAAAEVFTRARTLRSERLMIVSNAVSAGQLAADEAARRNIPLATLDDAADTLLRLHLPPQPHSPGLIWTGDDNPTRPGEVAAMLSAVSAIGGVVAILSPTGPADAAGVAALQAAQASLKMPLIAGVLGETTGAAHRRTLAEAGVPVFASPEQAVRGFGQLLELRRARDAARELPSSRVLTLAPQREAVGRLFAAARAEGRRALFQDEALDVLSAYGLPIVPFRATGPAEAADAAALLGFPITVKRRRLDPDEAGVLLLDLPDPAAVARAAAALATDTALLVQRQAGRAQRLRLTVDDDALFGPAIGFGPGGRARRAAIDLPPLNLTLAASLIARSDAAPLLEAGQGHAAANGDAVADALVRVSQLVIDFPEIATIRVDPLFADANGVSAAEAWISLRDGAPGRTAIAPYPAELVERWTSRAGEPLELRPIRPEDAEAHAAFVRRLTPEDIRYRFFSQIRELSREQIARMTQIDYDREMAFVAVRGADTVGVARLIEQGGGEAEFAVVVDPALKGSGLGRRLMDRIITWGRSRETRLITGQILADNARMLAFIRHLGFDLRRDREDPDIINARLSL